MRRLPGQVGRLLLGGVSFLLRLAMLLLIVGGAGIAALGWRLAQGPLAIPSVPLVDDLVADRLAPLAPGLRVGFARAVIRWEGWRDGAPLPLLVRLDGLRAVDAAGVARASLASAEALLDGPSLMRGVAAPVRAVLRAPAVMLRRDMEGDLALDLGLPPSPGAPAAPAGQAARGLEAGTEALRRALLPAAPGSPFALLRELRLEGGTVQVRDEPLRLDWTLGGVNLAITRGADGRAAMAGSGALRLAGQDIPVRLAGQVEGERPVASASLEIEAVNPPDLAAALPSLRPLAALEATLGARFSARYDFGDGAFAGRAEVVSSAGRIVAPDFAGPGAAAGRGRGFDGASLVLTGDGRRIALERFEIALPSGQPDRPATRVTAGARADRVGELWRGRLDLGLDAIAVPDLGLYWPVGAAEGARRWVTENLTAGVARDGRWFLEGEAAADLSDARLTGAGGTLRAEGATVHWLRPIPPLEGAEGLLTFSMEELVIQARGARQRGTALLVPEARIRVTDLGVPKPDIEKAEIDGRVTGPLADVLALVRQPRLHLFDRKPLEIGAVAGTVDARLSIGLPLYNDLPIDQLRIEVQGRVADGRVADVFRGQAVDRAQLDVSLDVRGMRVAGTARLGPVPARLRAELDFRSGAPDQVTERVRVEGRAELSDLRRLGLDAAPYAAGAVGFDIGAERRRSREARVALRADLRETRLALAPFGYAKPAGAPASAEAVVRLRGEALVAVEGLRVEGPDLSLRGGVTFRPGGGLAGAEVLEAAIGPSRLSGRVVSPGASGEPWDIRVRGTMLDARGLLRNLGGRGGGDPGSTPLRVDAAFDRVLLAEGRVLAPVRAVAFVDARGVLRELRAEARGAGGGGVEAVVVPRGAGRAMEARAEGFGTLLRDLGVFDAVDGGALHVAGEWPGNAPDSPLSGVAELRDFGVREAASIGKLLQALSVYGIAEAVRGPGLRFTVASAPFTLTPEALTLTEARAVSASLGLTVEGRILRRAERIDLRGTVVPSYAVNSALGRLPGIGRLFTAERQGGLFAANFRVTGRLDDPDFGLDPLSLLAPGALRGLLTGRQAP